MGWILTIIAGAIAGWLAEKVMKFNTGLLMNIVLGIVGALVMNFLLINIAGIAMGGFIGQVIAGLLGACLLIWVYRMIKSR